MFMDHQFIYPQIASLMALVNIAISYPSVVATLVAYHSTIYYPYRYSESYFYYEHHR